VSQLLITIPLGRVSMAHTAKPGLHLEQDQGTRFWRVASHGPKPTLAQRVRASVKAFAQSKVGIASVAAAAGVLLAVAANHLSGFSFRLNPELAFASPTQTTTIDVAQVAYTSGQLGSGADALPPPIQVQDSAVGAQMPLPTSAPIIPPSVSLPPVVPAASPPKAPPKAPPPIAAKVPVKDDSPMAVFNEPLPPKNPVSVSPPPQSPPQANQSIQATQRPGSPAVLVATKPPASQTTNVATPVAKQAVVQPPVGNSATTIKPTESQPTQPNAERGVAQQARILAVPDTGSIVITNPATRLPMVVKLGEPLPDGSTLKSVDKTASSAINSRGETLTLR
jgi:hypothetical protein